MYWQEIISVVILGARGIPSLPLDHIPSYTITQHTLVGFQNFEKIYLSFARVVEIFMSIKFPKNTCRSYKVRSDHFNSAS